MSVARAWPALEAAVLLGTRQAPSGVPVASGPIGAFLARIPAGDLEAALLSAAAALDVCAEAGRIAPRAPGPLPAPAPLDDAPAAPARAGALLLSLLRGEPAGLLDEWVATAARRGLRAPAAALPALLDHGRDHPRQRDAIAPVLGARGRWLAAQDPRWSWVAEGEGEADFAIAAHASRVRIVAALRRRDPGRARSLVEQAWNEEAPQRRAELLAALETGLSMADEPFLEERLADRRKEVRVAAAELLSRLVESRLARRMAARALAALRWQRRGFFASGERIEVELPGDLDAGAVRDGADASRARPGVGQKAAQLIAILGGTPLRTWTEAWDAPPERIVEAAARTELEETLCEGWVLAAERQRDGEWLRALSGRCPRRREDLTLRVVSALPAREREEDVVRRIVETLDARAMVHPVPALLGACDFVWGDALGRAALAFLRRYVTQEDKLALDELEQLFAACARRLPPAAAADAARDWPAGEHLSPPLRRALDRFCAVLDFRRQMHQDFAP